MLIKSLKSKIAFGTSRKGRRNAFKLIGGRQLKVAYKIKNDDIIIITAVFRGEK